jgi:large subunit ribosomal protein L23
MNKFMALKPRLSEKTYALSQLRNVYVFDVPTDANKMQVADAVEAQFKVTVLAVNVANVKGKAMRTVRKGGRPVAGRRANGRKAYVTLKEGDSLPVFAAVEEATTEEKPAKAKKETK